MATIHAFDPKPYPDSRTLIAPDGRRWCARSYFYPHHLARLTPGRSYSPGELVRLYGLPLRDGKPGLYLRPGEEMPEEVIYAVEPLGAR